MHLDPAVVQRFQSDVARLQPSFDRITHRFFERMKRDCPHVMRVVPSWNPRTRYEFAATFSRIVRRVDDAPVAPLRRALSSVGVTEQDLRIMHKALHHEIQHAAGREWNERMHADWNAVLHVVFAQLCPATHAGKLRAAA